LASQQTEGSASGACSHPTLIHVATIDIEAEGQAFAFTEGRTILAIDQQHA
jgi:hypothetical protein